MLQSFCTSTCSSFGIPVSSTIKWWPCLLFTTYPIAMRSITFSSYTCMSARTMWRSSIVMSVDSSIHDGSAQNTTIITLIEIEIWHQSNHGGLMTCCKPATLMTTRTSKSSTAMKIAKLIVSPTRATSSVSTVKTTETCNQRSENSQTMEFFYSSRRKNSKLVQLFQCIFLI